MTPITTNILRADYRRGNFSYGNPSADRKIVLIGSCRIVPLLNFFRVYNSLNGDTFQLKCYNPVEMWDGPGHEISEGVNRILNGHQMGHADYLICEHAQNCGVLNTVRTSEQNIYDSLGFTADVEIRLPNWNFIHIYDAETASYDKEGYGKLPHDERIASLRERTANSKELFLSHCRKCSFPEMEQWASDNWLTTRLGWTSNHPSYVIAQKLFDFIAEKIGITVTPELKRHPLYVNDAYQSTCTVLNTLDYEANGWKF